MPAITTPPDLTRTRAALAAYDVIDREVMDDMMQDEADDFFKRSDAAKLAIGEAFALDTADRNEFEVARSWLTTVLFAQRRPADTTDIGWLLDEHGVPHTRASLARLIAAKGQG